VIPWYVRDIAVPVGLATALGALRIDGRPFHVAAQALVSFALRSRRLHNLSAAPRTRWWIPPEILLIPDGSDARFRHIRFRGPGAVLVKRPHLRAEWSRLARADVTLHPLDGVGDGTSMVELAAGAVLEVRTR
jgi:hypothetical protein